MNIRIMKRLIKEEDKARICCLDEHFLDQLRVFITSDTHGHCEELISLLEECHFDPDDARMGMIYLGDFVDRGKDEEGLFLKLCSLREKMGSSRMLWLMGNHEKDLIEKKNDFPMQLTERQLALAEQIEKLTLPHVIHIGNMVMCHAAYQESDDREADYYLNNRDVHLGRRNPSENHLVITGHTPVSFIRMNRGQFPQEHTPLYIDSNGNAESIPEETDVPLPDNGVIVIDCGAGNNEYLCCLEIHNGMMRVHIKKTVK